MGTVVPGRGTPEFLSFVYPCIIAPNADEFSLHSTSVCRAQAGQPQSWADHLQQEFASLHSTVSSLKNPMRQQRGNTTKGWTLTIWLVHWYIPKSYGNI